MEKYNEPAVENKARVVNNADECRLSTAKTAVAFNCAAKGQQQQQQDVTTAWLAMHANNNNIAQEINASKQRQQLAEENAQKRWNCESCEAVGVVAVNAGVGVAVDVGLNATNYNKQCITDDVAGARVTTEDEGGGVNNIGRAMTTTTTAMRSTQQNGAVVSQLNRHATMPTLASINIPEPSAQQQQAQHLDSVDIDAYAVGAASLTPPGNSHSNRTSINNSTENLSYSSDNYYPDNLILLDDDDVEAEEISLNSDDCVYAYRGVGADFDLPLDTMAGRVGDAGIMDDETDFLEMDFEPDPCSDDYGVAIDIAPHADAFQLQRDACHLSGRHSANLSLHTTPVQRQLFSSPIEDIPPPKALQAQSLLSKNFARITLHLDQIKGESTDCDEYELVRNERVLSTAGDTIDLATAAATATTTAAHSLPSTLHASFIGRETHERQEHKASPSKITGAKPKRLSTFSTSSSTSSKNSSKSRTSLRSAFTPALYGSSSFDERSVSCTEFRSNIAAEDCVVPTAIAATASTAAATVTSASSSAVVSAATCDDLNTYDDACLDCLEKEFLANTIGIALTARDCAKCRKLSSSISLYARAEQARCRSGSPPLFFNATHDERLFEQAAADWTVAKPLRKRADWLAAHVVQRNNKTIASNDATVQLLTDVYNAGDGSSVTAKQSGSTTCDIDSGAQLQKNLLLTEKEIATISTLNLNEETLVQALDSLHISYNAELIKTHFQFNTLYTHAHNNNIYINANNNNNSGSSCSGVCGSNNNNILTTTQQHKTLKNFKNFKHFILHASKQNCNYPKLQRLIDLATQQQLIVQFKKHAYNATAAECVQVSVADILQQWTRHKSLDTLQQLDKRFQQANVLGKIANIIRQAQQRCTMRRTLPEFITIPQYYPSGYLTLTKKC